MEYRSNKSKLDSDSSDSEDHSSLIGRWDRTKIAATNGERDDDLDDGGPPPMESRQSLISTALSAVSSQSESSGGSFAVFSTNGDQAINSHVTKKRKVNSIWADVIAEQQLTQTISSGSKFSMKDRRRATLVRRGPESYDRTEALKRDSESRDKDETMATESNKNNDNLLKNEQNFKNKHNRKRMNSYQNEKGGKYKNFKNNHFQPKPMNFETNFDKTEESKNLDEFSKKLTLALSEPKFDLIDRCVKNLGVEKSIDFFEKTKTIEKNGGRMISNQSRRRSPGGIFLELIKNDPEIDEEIKSKIFQ